MKTICMGAKLKECSKTKCPHSKPHLERDDCNGWTMCWTVTSTECVPIITKKTEDNDVEHFITIRLKVTADASIPIETIKHNVCFLINEINGDELYIETISSGLEDK